MNNKDRNRIIDLYDLADKVPFPHDGTGSATASIKGYADYAADMREFTPAFKAALYGIICNDREGLIKGEDYEDPDVIITALKAWVEERRQNQWDRPTIYWQFFYEDYKKEQERNEEVGGVKTPANLTFKAYLALHRSSYPLLVETLKENRMEWQRLKGRKTVEQFLILLHSNYSGHPSIDGLEQEMRDAFDAWKKERQEA